MVPITLCLFLFRLYLFWLLLESEVRIKAYSNCLAPKINSKSPLSMSFAISTGMIFKIEEEEVSFGS